MKTKKTEIKDGVGQRGKKGQWYALIEVEVREGEKRKRRRHRLEGCNGRTEARAKRALLIAQQAEGSYVDPSKITVAEWVRPRIDQWEAAGKISARTAQRYRQLLEKQIVPHLGDKPLQKLTRLDMEAWHTTLRNSGLAPRTIGHAHRVLGKALRDAEHDGKISKNVCKLEAVPKVSDDEMVIVRDIPALLAQLKDWRHGTVAMVALFTGMRLGEVLALRWNNVDLDKAQLELRMQLGAGRLPDDALLFATIEGQPWAPNLLSTLWLNFAHRIGMADVTFHALRHTHASQLIDQGVDIVTISKRLGHSKPDVTLRVYAHMFRKDDGIPWGQANTPRSYPAKATRS